MGGESCIIFTIWEVASLTPRARPDGPQTMGMLSAAAAGRAPRALRSEFPFQPIGEGDRQALHATLQSLLGQRLIGGIRNIGRYRVDADRMAAHCRNACHPLRIGGPATAE